MGIAYRAMKSETVIVKIKGRIQFTVLNALSEQFEDVQIFDGSTYRDQPNILPQSQSSTSALPTSSQETLLVEQRDDYNHVRPRVAPTTRTKYKLNTIGSGRWFWQDLIIGTEKGTLGVSTIEFAFSSAGYLDVFDTEDDIWKSIELIYPGDGSGSDADPTFSFSVAGYLDVLDPRDSTTKQIPLVYNPAAGGTVVNPRFQWNTDGYLDVFDESDSLWKTIPLLIP